MLRPRRIQNAPLAAWSSICKASCTGMHACTAGATGRGPVRIRRAPALLGHHADDTPALRSPCCACLPACAPLPCRDVTLKGFWLNPYLTQGAALRQPACIRAHTCARPCPAPAHPAHPRSRPCMAPPCACHTHASPPCACTLRSTAATPANPAQALQTADRRAQLPCARPAVGAPPARAYQAA